MFKVIAVQTQHDQVIETEIVAVYRGKEEAEIEAAELTMEERDYHFISGDPLRVRYEVHQVA